MHFFLKILDLLYGKIHMNSEDKISMSFGKETGTSYLVNIAPAFIGSSQMDGGVGRRIH